MNSADILLTLSVFTVAALTAGGMAMRSVSRIWLRHWVEQQLRGSRAALAYLEKPQRLIIASSATVALILVLSGELIASDHARNLKALAISLSVFAISVIVLGQLLPRAIARRFAPTVASFLSPLLEAAAIIAAPIVAAGRLASRPFEKRSLEEKTSERDAIQDLLREGELEGVGEKTEMAIISGVVQFGNKTLDQIMTPRSDVFAIDERVRGADLALRIAQSRYSRVPIYRETLDNVIGMIHVFDVLKEAEEDSVKLRPVAEAPTTAHCNDFLFEMLRGRRHLAVVRDADGKLAGIVTLEDLLEELVGDIRDEHDEPGGTAEMRAGQMRPGAGNGAADAPGARS